jgi:hypothetical protein
LQPLVAVDAFKAAGYGVYPQIHIFQWDNPQKEIAARKYDRTAQRKPVFPADVHRFSPDTLLLHATGKID